MLQPHSAILAVAICWYSLQMSAINFQVLGEETKTNVNLTITIFTELSNFS